MPLQLRRGSDSDRSHMSTPLARGELIYCEDTHALWVGDGHTLGGIAIANLSMVDVQNIDANLLTNGNHTGISFTYVPNPSNPSLSKINAAINVELSNYQGVIRASSFNGSLVSDDSVTVFDAITGTLKLDGTIDTDIVPSAFGPDLGSAGIPFNNVYVGGNLRVGLGTITPVSTYVDLPAGSTVGGVAIGSGGGGGPSIGNFVFSSNTIDIGSQSAIITSTNREAFDVKSLTTGSSGGIPYICVKASKGTIATPTTTAPGDKIGGITIQGYANGDFQSAATIFAEWESTATLTDGNPASKISIATGNNSSGVNLLTFNSAGLLSSTRIAVGDGSASSPSIAFTTDGGVDTGFSHPSDGVIVVSANANEVARFDTRGFRSLGFVKVAQVSGTLPSPAEAGMIVLDGTTFKGYNGSAWVNLN